METRTRGYIEIDIPGICLDCPVVFVGHTTVSCRVVDKLVPLHQPRPDWCPIKEHDLGKCAEKHKAEMEALHVAATKRLGW